MSKDEMLRLEQNLMGAMKKYLKVYHEIEKLPEFKDLSRSARGTGMISQYHQSVQDAIVERARHAGAELRRGVYEKATKLYPDVVEELSSAIREAEAFLISDASWQEKKNLTEMVTTLKGTYLPK